MSIPARRKGGDNEAMTAGLVRCGHCGQANRVPAQNSQRFGVQAIPTLLVLRRGQVTARQTGAVPLAALRTWVDSALAAAR